MYVYGFMFIDFCQVLKFIEVFECASIHRISGIIFCVRNSSLYPYEFIDHLAIYYQFNQINNRSSVVAFIIHPVTLLVILEIIELLQIFVNVNSIKYQNNIRHF